MQTDSQRTAAIADKDRRIQELEEKLAALEDGSGPDLVLEEHAFTYSWRGQTYGINVAEIMTKLNLTPESLRESADTDVASKIKEEAAMPNDLPLDHVLKIMLHAVRKTIDLGKVIEPA